MKKETKEVAIVDFTKFDVAQLPELIGKKNEIAKVIKANPVVKITDNASYELAKKSRTAVKTLRTGLEKEKKDVNDRIKKNVLEVVANEYDLLIEAVKVDENARQEGVSAWEEIKENERLEKLRLEQERVDGIKMSIGEFRSFWEGKLSEMNFNTIEDTRDDYSVAVVEFDRESLGEFDVLFTDAILYLDNIFGQREKTLIEQEEIRIQQIELAKEKERQRIESERIAEQQRIEREKFEAEQKRIAEENRIAQEKLALEKLKFEEEKLKARTESRVKQLTDAGCVFLEDKNCYQKDIYYLHFDDIQSADDDMWVRELMDCKAVVIGESVKIDEPTTQEVEFEDAKSEEFANDVETQTFEQTGNILLSKEDKTWSDIYVLFLADTDTIYLDKTSITDFINWCEERYNCPTLKF